MQMQRWRGKSVPISLCAVGAEGGCCAPTPVSMTHVHQTTSCKMLGRFLEPDLWPVKQTHVHQHLVDKMLVLMVLCYAFCRPCNSECGPSGQCTMQALRGPCRHETKDPCLCPWHLYPCPFPLPRCQWALNCSSQGDVIGLLDEDHGEERPGLHLPRVHICDGRRARLSKVYDHTHRV